MNAFFRKATAVAALSFVAVAGTASRAEAQDFLNFVGSVNLNDQPGNPANLLADFLVNGSVAGTPTGTITAVETVNGAFLPEIVPGVTQGTITDILISNSGVLNTPINPFVQIGGYTFTLNSSPAGNTFGPISLFGTATGTTATFGVMGTVTGGDYGATPRNYTGLFTSQFTGLTPEQVFNQINFGPGFIAKSYSAEFVVAAPSVIPEPSTYALMATGLGMLGFVARRRRSTQV